MNAGRGGMRRGVYLLPSILTLGNLSCGFYALVAVYNDEYVTAAVAILLALVFDYLDGGVARMTGATSDLGIELDSLADLASFGVAPGLLACVFALKPFGWVDGVGQHPGRESSTISCGWLGVGPHPLRLLGENAGRDAFVCSAAVIGSRMKSASAPDAHSARNCAHGDHTRPHQTHRRPKERDSLNS